MIAFCPVCLAEQPVDTLLARTGDNTEPDPAPVFAPPDPQPATNLADGLAAALWRHAGRLAGGAW